MKAAVIDLGTNTFNLLIVEIPEGKAGFQVLYQKKIPVKIGEGGIGKKEIHPDAMKRAEKALRKHAKTIKKWQADHKKAFATSAVRDAKNQREFTTMARKIIGFPVEVIDGTREAELIWKGVKQATSLGNTKHLIMDIGGGSTEFIIADQSTVFYKCSTQLGASRLLDLFHPSDPIKEEDIETIHQHLKKELTPLLAEEKKHDIHTLLGSSGSFETLAAIASHKIHNKPLSQDKTTYHLPLNTYDKIHEKLLLSSYEDRLKMKGMVKMRADMIVIGSILINFIIKNTNINKIKVASFALKEGVISEIGQFNN